MNKKIGKVATLATAVTLAMTGCQKQSSDIDYDSMCKITDIKKDTSGGVDETLFSISCEDGDKITQVSIEEKYDEGNIGFSNFNADKYTDSNITLAGDLCPKDIELRVTDFEHSEQVFNGDDIYEGDEICNKIGESFEGDDIIGENY